MRHTLASAIPVLVAGAVLVLASPVVRAQQEHDHSTTAAAGQACACCGNSGSAAMNHEAGGGCCGGMATNQAKTSPAADAAPMNHQGGGCCGNMAMGKGEGGAMPMGDASMSSDMQLFHYLLENRAQIHRTVKMLPNGIDTLTESDNPEVAAKLKTHVSAMYARLKDGRPIHQRDPLFAELFAHADQIDANIAYTAKGLHVVETSADPAVARLLHKHAEVVDAFIKNGMPEMMKNHLE